MVVPGAGGRGSVELVSNENLVSVWDDEKVLETMVGTVAQHCECA